MAKKAPVDEVEVVPAPGPGKGRATPSRREQQAARRRPIVVSDRKEARKASRTRVAAERDRARVGMARGEERYLPQRDRGPQRRYARDYIDSQWTFGEFLIPMFVLFFVATLLVPRATWLFLPLYGYLAITIADGLIRARIIRKRLAERLGGKDKVDSGLNLYTVMRSAQFRSLRMPKPQVRRGEKVA